MDLATKSYPGGFDGDASRAWLLERMKDDRLVFLRGERAAGIANVVPRFWGPSRMQCYMLFVAAYPCDGTYLMEPFFVMDAMREWGKSKGATAFWFSDITGADLGAYAKRRGGRLAGHTYVIDIDGKGTPYG